MMNNKETLDELKDRQFEEFDKIAREVRVFDRDLLEDAYILGVRHTEERQEWFGSRNK